ncbi:MAG: AAA family ATPase [Desulfovibrio sp.]|jgi:predicted AAA+ superfamily ATPase|nr:AAA family ATPase [Desulfovibrio sp.]
MNMYIPRALEPSFKCTIRNNPVSAIIGPKYSGKTAIAKHICNTTENCCYLDLEKDTDLAKIDEGMRASTFLRDHMDGYIILDEIHFRPNIFSVMRPLADEIAHSRDNNFRITHPARFIVLGSASPTLLKQTKQSLVGRISYWRLTNLLVTEIPNVDMRKYIMRGGFPSSYLATDAEESAAWLKSYINDLLDKNLSQWGNFSSEAMAQLWEIITYHNGLKTNDTKIIGSFQNHADEAKAYIQLLKRLYLIDTVGLYSSDPYKLIDMTPKIFIADSGIVLASMGIQTFEALTSPANATIYDIIWRSIVLVHLRAWFPDLLEHNIFFYRDKKQNEIDLILYKNQKLFAIECKTSPNAYLSSVTYAAMKKLQIPKEHAFIVAPFPSSDGKANAITLPELRDSLKFILCPLEDEE